VSPFNNQTAFLGLSGYTALAATNYIFVTTNFGSSWSIADGNPDIDTPPPSNALPDVPVLKLLVDKTDPTGNTIWAGTDTGVYQSTDGGNDRVQFTAGMPEAVPVFDLEQNSGGTISAATHGRGIYQLSSGSPTPAPSDSPSATSTPSITPTPSRTPTSTPSPTGTASHTATPTPTASATATATATHPQTLRLQLAGRPRRKPPHQP
jgi:hypothetical protein